MTKEREALKLAQRALSNKNAPTKLIYEALTAIKAALEAKDEPVAWICIGRNFVEIDCPAEDDFRSTLGWEPLFTAPPQRTWVGLTDKDWNRSKHNYDFQKGVDWAESILKEKNA